VSNRITNSLANPDPARRRLLQSLTSIAFASAVPTRLLHAATALRFRSDPFLLGVASGYPSPNGVVLWTRLMTSLAEPHREVEAQTIPVEWHIAADDKMRKVVRKGTVYATPEFAHSIHLELTDLKPGRDYWYRFTAGGMQSVIGHTRTAPALHTKLERLRIAVASCQKYENGYFVAYRHMLNDAPDLIVHTGDYIYEYASTVGGSNIRGDGSDEAFTLDQYRARYALYKNDADLRAVHAACPWLMTWDDHEVANDYFGDASYEQSGEEFLLRRAAAYRAYYEHMPLPRSALPTGPHMQLHAQRSFGNLLNIHMLDSRQHRSPLACRGADDDGGPGARCASLFDSTRTKLGQQQETWLSGNLAKSSARWNVLAQGTPMAHVDLDPGEGVAYRRDSWDGYPAARQRLLDTLVNTKTNNPIIVDGDIHAFQVANLNAKANDPTSPIIASEFTTDSITSSGISQTRLDQNRQNNPNILFSDSRQRGYTLLDFSPHTMRADLVTVESIRTQDADRNLLASFVVENGKPGPVKV
jgi:alkaline phosphatase D